MREPKKKKGMKSGIYAVLFALSVCVAGGSASAGTLAESEYVTFTNDGAERGWTFNEALPVGFDPQSDMGKAFEVGVYVTADRSFSTGIVSSVRELTTGEHYYGEDREGEIPIGYWKVAHIYGKCIHKLSADIEQGFLGLDFNKNICGGRYYSGWNAYCADCGGVIGRTTEDLSVEHHGDYSQNGYLVYGSEQAIRSITSIDTSLKQYYLCPTCNHLEQGVDFKHTCKKISPNRYQVLYDANVADAEVGGYMSPSFHMYNNATEYEGEAVVPQKNLNKNTYHRIGYEFTGWNTMPDGSGTYFADMTEVYNLSAENYDAETEAGVITLYAQWKLSTSTLHINAGGGTYDGEAVYSVTKGYMDTFKVSVDRDTLVPPAACTVLFKPDAGIGAIMKDNAPATVYTEKLFSQWTQTVSHGSFKENADGSGNGRYTFLGKSGTSDTLVANYANESIVLPGVVKTGYCFVGWYADEALTQFVGAEGATYTPPANKSSVTLYAKCVDLYLKSIIDLTTDGGKGGVDLRWWQKDRMDKIYKVYQRAEGKTDFTEITSMTQDVELTEIADKSYTDITQTHYYTVGYEGFYTVTAYGGSGGNFAWEGIEYKGGKGGSLEATFYLRKGEKLVISVGAKEGGGKGTAGIGANGGGATVIQKQSTNGSVTTLLVAGGGAGAQIGQNGANGGGTGLAAEAGGVTGGDGSTADKSEGGAGGGAGSPAGSGGSYTPAHVHTVACYHVHTGESTGTDCYSSTQVIPCEGENYDGTANHTWNRYSSRYYGYVGGGTCEQCGKSQAEHTTQQEHYEGLWECTLCGRGKSGSYPRQKTIRESAQPEWGWEHHSVTKPAISCPLPTDVPLYCPENSAEQMISVAATAGGNYIHESSISYVSRNAADTKASYGNGEVIISAKALGYTDALTLSGVSANDKAAPEKVPGETAAYSVRAVENNSVYVVFSKPADRGTTYEHRVDSYDANTQSKLLVSNVTKDTILTGIRGYYYVVDNRPGTTVTLNNAQNKDTILLQDKKEATCSVTVKAEHDVNYLHIAAVDVAGNLSETTHLKLEGLHTTTDLETSQILVLGKTGGVDDGNIYKDPAADGKTYYVKADGRTRFTLRYSSFMYGEPKSNFMIDYAIFKLRTGGVQEQYTTRVNSYVSIPCLPQKEYQLDASSFERSVSVTHGGESILKDAMNTGGKRTIECTSLTFYQAFTVDAVHNGKNLLVMPIAGITTNNPYIEEDVIYSAEEKDTLRGVTLIPDAEGPVIGGMEAFEGVNVINRNQFFGMNLEVKDALSGLDSCKVMIENVDNYKVQYYVAEIDEVKGVGKLSIDFAEGNALFDGDFRIVIEACDKVGNKIVREYGQGGIGLTASIYRILEPHAPVFKCGESGVLTIETYGDINRIEVEFPNEMVARYPNLNRTFYYEGEEKVMQEEELQFMVPLYTSEGDYTITVRAFGQGSVKEAHPTLTVVGGGQGILGELRTRLR